MSARKPKQTEDKPTRKKLRLSKETLKDLTDPKGSAKGGVRVNSVVTCTCACGTATVR